MTAFLLMIVSGVCIGCGFLFAVVFVLGGAGRIDQHAARGSWGFRLIIVPGAIAFWPLLLRHWLKGIHAPPEEATAHRKLARAQPHQAR